MNESSAQRRRLWWNLVIKLVGRELKVRYKGSVIGYLWSMVNPLLYMIILGFVFSHVMRYKQEHYTLFILSGILVWNLFSQGIVLGTASIINNASLMKKVRIPETIFPAASIGSCLVNFSLALIPYIIVHVVLTARFPFHLFLMPLVLVPLVLFVYGIALALSSLNVMFRDVQHLIEPVLNMIFYATPIIYPIEVIPEKFRWILALNPLAHFVGATRSFLYASKLPEWPEFGILYVMAALSLVLGWNVYKPLRRQFIYRL